MADEEEVKDEPVATEAPEVAAPEDQPAEESVKADDPPGSAPSGPSRAAISCAARAGISDEDIDACQTDAELDRLTKVAVAYQQKPVSGNGNRAKAEEVNIDAIPDLDPEEASEKVIAAWGALKKTLKAIQSQNAELRQVAEDAHKRVDVQDGNTERDWFDGQISKLAGHEETFGSGGFEDIADNPKYMDARKKLAAEYIRLKKNGRDRNAFKTAYQYAFGAQTAAKAAQAEKTAKREKQVINAPTQRRATPEKETGKSEAVKIAAKKIAEFAQAD